MSKSNLPSRIEGEEVGSRELDAEVWCVANGYDFIRWDGGGVAYRRPGHQMASREPGDWIKPYTSSLDAALALVERVRAGADLPQPPEGQYSTRWLNGAAERDPEVDGKIAAQAEDRRQQQAARDAAIAERDQRFAAALETAEALRPVSGKFSPLDDRYAPAVAQLGHQLPLTVSDQGHILNADGSIFLRFEGWEAVNAGVLAKRWLIAIGMNAAAGLATPDAPPPPAEGEDHEDDDGELPEDDDDFDAEEGDAEAGDPQPALAEAAGGGSRALYQDDFAQQVRETLAD